MCTGIIRRFQNNCEIAEETNSPSKNYIRVKLFSLIKGNIIRPQMNLVPDNEVKGQIARTNFSIIPETSINGLFHPLTMTVKTKLSQRWANQFCTKN